MSNEEKTSEKQQSKSAAISQKMQSVVRQHFSDAVNTIMETKADTVNLPEERPALDKSAQIAETPDLSNIAREIRRKPDNLAQQKLNAAIEKDLNKIQEKTGLKISMQLQAGEKGVYRGMHEVAGRSYGLIEKADGTAKLIPARHLECREKGKTVQIEKRCFGIAKEIFKGVEDGSSKFKDKGRYL